MNPLLRPLSISRTIALLLCTLFLLFGNSSCKVDVTINPNDSDTSSAPRVIGVEASSDDGDNIAFFSIDENSSTYWSASGDGEWITYQLSEQTSVSYVEIAFHRGDQRRSFFDVQTSLNGTDWNDIATDLASSGNTTELERFDFDPVRALYVRFAGHGNDQVDAKSLNSYLEVRIEDFEIDISCVPNNNECGDNGCGSSHPDCPENWDCVKGVCKENTSTNLEDIYSIPDATDPMYTGGVVYIDPSSSTNGDGTEANPFNSWAGVNINENTAYLQKRGTTAVLTESLTLPPKNNNVLIGAYGSDSERPVIEINGGKFAIRSDGNVIRDLKFHCLLQFGRAGTNSQVKDNTVFNCEIDGRAKVSIGIVSWGGDLLVLGCEIHDVGMDGIYTENHTGGPESLEIAYNHIYKVNLNFHSDPSETGSPGDNIQIAVSNAHVHHNILDRRSTGNKFCFIGGDGGDDYTGPRELLLEHNIMYLPLSGPNGSSAIYLADEVSPIIRNNQLIKLDKIGPGYGIRASDHGITFKIYGNLFVGMDKAIYWGAGEFIVYNNTIVGVNETGSGGWDYARNNILPSYAKGLDDSNLFIDVVGAHNLFANPDKGDYSLAGSSPAIDAGKWDEAQMIDYLWDLDGKPIPHNSTVDVGAYQN